MSDSLLDHFQFYRKRTTPTMAEHEEETDLTPEAPRERTFALSSRRLKGAIISRIAAELGVPTGGSLEDRRQMVEDALTDAGREPRNVVVCVLKTDEGIAIRVEDESGVFMELPPFGSDPRRGDSPTDSGEDCGEDSGGPEGAGGGGGPGTADHAEDGTESGAEVELQRAYTKITELQGGVSALGDEIENVKAQFERQIVGEREQLAKEKERYRGLWSKYCARCSRDDEVITSMEWEMEGLRKRLSESVCRPSPRSPTPMTHVVGSVHHHQTKSPTPVTHVVELAPTMDPTQSGAADLNT